MKTRTKQQHIVPRFVIEAFENAEGYVQTYDAVEQTNYKNLSKNTAKQGNIYSPISGGKRLDLIEDLFSRIESEAAPIHQKIVAGEKISDDDKVIYSYFLSAQYVRSPKTMAAGAEVIAKMQHHMAMLNINSTRQDLNLKHFASNTENYNLIVNEHVGLLSIGQIDIIAEFINSYGWFVALSADVQIITSDSPVSRLTNPQMYHPIYGDGGFTGRDTYIQFPLSPNKLLICGNNINFEFATLSIKSSQAKNFNRQTVQNAKQYLYMRNFDSRIQRMIRNSYRGSNLQQVHTSFDAPKVFVTRHGKIS
jgi:hypothetical protein